MRQDRAPAEGVCTHVRAFFGPPVMIDPRLTRSTLTHQCSFKCLLPWKQAADIKVCYTDNGLSASTPAALPIIYLNFLLSFHPSIFPFCSIRRCPAPSRRRSLFSFNLTFLPLSFIRSTPLPRSHVSVPATLFIIISTCRIIRFISLLPFARASTRMPFNPPHRCYLLTPPPLLFFSSALLLVWTQARRNACRH